MIVARDAVAGGLATDVEEGVVLGVVTINQIRVRIRDIGEAPLACGASFHSAFLLRRTLTRWCRASCILSYVPSKRNSL
jgi:hypothetical protein